MFSNGGRIFKVSTLKGVAYSMRTGMKNRFRFFWCAERLIFELQKESLLTTAISIQITPRCQISRFYIERFRLQHAKRQEMAFWRLLGRKAPDFKIIKQITLNDTYKWHLHAKFHVSTPSVWRTVCIQTEGRAERWKLRTYHHDLTIEIPSEYDHWRSNNNQWC